MKRDNGLTINEAIRALNNKNQLNEAVTDSINLSDCTKIESLDQLLEICENINNCKWPITEEHYFNGYTNHGTHDLYVYEDGDDSFWFTLDPRSNRISAGPYDKDMRDLRKKVTINLPKDQFFWFDGPTSRKKTINIKDCTKLTSFEQARDLIQSLGAYWGLQEQRFFDAYKKQMNLYIYEDGKNSICFGVYPNGKIHGPFDVKDRQSKDIDIILFDID